uniref:Putative lipocalin n=1 Tax=Ixodes ricinus TaxID=34613 RepID=V5ICL4_IXORI
MGLLYAAFFACIAMASFLWKEWTTQMIIKNPENNPLLNSKLGHFQNAWKSIEMTTNNTYVLMFRTKNRRLVCKMCLRQSNYYRQR